MMISPEKLDMKCMKSMLFRSLISGLTSGGHFGSSAGFCASAVSAGAHGTFLSLHKWYLVQTCILCFLPKEWWEARLNPFLHLLGSLLTCDLLKDEVYNTGSVSMQSLTLTWVSAPVNESTHA